MTVPRLSQETLAEKVGTTDSRVSFFMNRFRKPHLVIHLAHDIIRRENGNERQTKCCRCPVNSTTLPKTVLQRHPVAKFSEQELPILQLFASGKNSPEISKSLQNSLQTRYYHFHHINQKLRTHNRLEAVMQAIQRKLLQLLPVLRLFTPRRFEISLDHRPSDMMVVSTQVRTNYFKEPARVK